MPAVIAIFEDERWQMTIGERAALEGILSQLKPNLALEIGTAQGGSLARIAEHSGEVHSFDRYPPPEAERFPDVHFHTGDSHEILRPWLDGIREEGRRLDFVLVDGDHSSEGVRADIQDVFESGALEGVMLFHDSMNPEVRRGIKDADIARYPGVRYVDFDFVAGHLTRYRQGGEYFGQLWGGLGVAVVGVASDSSALKLFASRGARQNAFYSTHALVRPSAEVVGLPARFLHWLRRRARLVYHSARGRLKAPAGGSGGE
jgi:hypothetical protein